MERFVGPGAGESRAVIAEERLAYLDVMQDVIAASLGGRAGAYGGREIHVRTLTDRLNARLAAETSARLLAAAEAVCEAFPKTDPLTPRARALEDLRAAVASVQQDQDA